MTFGVAARPTRTRALLMGAVSFLALATAAGAADVTWSGGAGNWNDAARWIGGVAPGAADNAFVDGGNATDSVVTVTTNATIEDVTIDAGDRVSVNNGVTFSMNGDLDNDGVFALGSSGGFTTLRIGGDALFSGVGAVELSDSSVNRIIGATDSTLTNAAGHTIRGAGSFGGSVIGLDNAGLVEAVGAAPLTLQFRTTDDVLRRNTGVMRATNGATLSFTVGVLDNQGVLEAEAGGLVSITGGSTGVVGGTLTGDGVFSLGGSAELRDVTNQSAVVIANGQIGEIVGDVANEGVISLQSAGSFTRMAILDGLTLNGDGVLEMSNAASNQITGAFDATLTNGAEHTIRGAGSIGVGTLGLDNEGLIEAVGDSGLTVQLRTTEGVTRRNAGVMRATDGATLTIGAGVIDNGAGVLEAEAGGVVAVTGGTTRIDGGRLTGEGLFTLSASADLKDLTNESRVLIANGQTGEITGEIVNDGVISLDSAGGFTTLFANGGATLGGDGVVEMSNFAANRIFGTTDSVLTNTADHTIRGAGNIGVGLIGLDNEGLIEAVGDSGLTVQLRAIDGVTRRNAGVMRATAGSTLIINTVGLDNADGAIEAAAGGAVSIVNSNTRVQGGVLRGEGDFFLSGSADLSDLTNESTVRITNGQTGEILGVIENAGLFSLESAGGFTSLRLVGDAALEGDGAVEMSDFAVNRISGVADTTLRNGADHTIRGSGDIGVNAIGLDNEGLVEAVGAAGLTLRLRAGENVLRRNTGILRATNGSSLTIDTAVLDNEDGVIESEAGGVVRVRGSATRVVGGRLVGPGGFFLEGSSDLEDVTNESVVTVANGQTGEVLGDIVNNGRFEIDSIGSFTTLRILDDTSFSGEGELAMSDRSVNRLIGVIDAVLTNAAGHTISGAGLIGGNFIGLVNAGLIEATGDVALTIDPRDSVGPVVNTGAMRASGAGGLSLTAGAYDNQGLFEAVDGSTLRMSSNATLENNSGGVLTAGRWRAAGNGSRIEIRGGQVETNAAEIELSGAGSSFVAFQGVTPVELEDSLTSNTGALRVLDDRDFAAANDLVNSGVIELGGGTLSAPSLENTATGEIFGFGAVTPNIANSGVVRALGGALEVSNGVTAASGSVISEAGATVVLGAPSSAELLDLRGGALALGPHDITVSGDYRNAAFGVGDAFDRRANVSGAGAIVGEGAGLGVGGDVVADVLDFGTVRGGDTATLSYSVDNTGAGASIRGAIRTGAGGGSVTDARLSGAGVTAQNYGPVAAGESAGPFDVTFAANQGGALAGQSVGIAQNFDNLSDRVVRLEGFATALAQGAADPAGPVDLGAFRVGMDGPSQSFAVTNTTTGPGAESLGLASAQATGAFAGFNDLGAGRIAAGAVEADAARVAVSGGAAGVNQGELTLRYVTDGTDFDAGFTAQDANSDVIAVSATGFNVAEAGVSPAPVIVANQRVGGSESVALTISNTAPAGAFTEALNAAVDATTGAATSNGGTVSGLAGGGSDSTSVTVGVDASSAGAKTGQVRLAFESDGAGSSGLGVLALADQNVQVQGDVFALAEGRLDTTALNFGTVQVGQVVGQALSISNVATGPDGFVEDLDASFGAASGLGAGRILGTGSISGLAAGGTDAASMNVSVDTSAAGAIDGSIAVDYVSAGAVGGVSNGLGALAVGSDDFAVRGLIETTGSVIDAASPRIDTAQPIDLGNVRVGDAAPTAAVGVTNVATGNEQAALNATISGAGAVTASGAFDLLAPGASDAASLTVGLDTSAAGAVDAAATVAFVSDASNVGGCGANCRMTLPSQSVQVVGGVFALAEPDLPGAVDVGNFRLGEGAAAALTIANAATAPAGFQEGLDAAVSAVAGAASASGGPIANLAAGAASSAISVGIDGAAATAGLNSGTVTLGLASNGDGTSGLGALALPDATVDVTGTGFRLADPVLNTTAATLAARVGDASPTAGISVTNASPDVFTEALDASAGPAPAGFAASGGVTGLAAGATEANAVTVGLQTGVAGAFSGQLDVDFTSSGAGTTGAADMALGAATVDLTGRVYQAAEAELLTSTVDFGIVHVGEAVGARMVGVRNAAPGAALNDTLAATLDGLPASAFSGAGAVSGLGAGESSTALEVALDTSSAGVFDATGDFVAFKSQNPDLADLDLPSGRLNLLAQVNNFANPVFGGLLGDGTLTGSGTLFTLDFGSVLLGDALFATFGVENDMAGPVDLLSGSFDLFGGGPFQLSGFDDFSGIGGGESVSGLGAGLQTTSTGTFMQSIFLNAAGSNASGYFGAFAPIELKLTVEVRDDVAAIPLPATVWMLLASLLGLGGTARIRARRSR